MRSEGWAVAYEHHLQILSLMPRWHPFTWPTNWEISNFRKRVDESRIRERKGGNLLCSLCLVVKSAEQQGTVQKKEAAIFRWRFTCCCRASESEACPPRMVSHGRCGWVAFASLLLGGWAFKLEGTLQSCTGGLQKKLNTSAIFYSIDQHYSRCDMLVRRKKRLTRLLPV